MLLGMFSGLTLIQWTGTIAIALILLGVMLTCLLGVMRGMLWLVTLSSRLGQRLWAYLWHTPLVSHGAAHFASAVEVQQAGFFDHPEHLPLAQFDGRTLYEPVGGSVALIAPPRSHKSWGVLMPCIRAFPGSVICHDPRSELWQHTHTERESHGPVLKFDPASKMSAAIDPLALIRWKEDQEHGDLQRLTLALLSPEPGATWSEYALEAVPLLAALLIERHEAGAQGLGAVVRCLVDPQTTLKAKFEALLKHPHPTVAQAARRMVDKSEARQAAVVQHLLSSLNVFTDPLVDMNTSHNDLDLLECIHGAQPVTVYWCSEFSEARRLRPLFGCLLEQLLARLGSPGEKRHRVLLALDEAMALGYSPELESGMSHFAGDGIQVLLAFQNANQVTRTYGLFSPLLDSIPTSMYFTPTATDLTTREEISTILGVSTVEFGTRSQRVSIFGMLQSETLGSQRIERRLMTSDEVAQMPEDAAILVTKAHSPVMCRKLDAEPVPLVTLPQRYKRPAIAATAAALLMLSFWTTGHFLASSDPTPTLAMTTTHEGSGIGAPHQAPSRTPDPTPPPVPTVASQIPIFFPRAPEPDQAPWRLTRQRGALGPETPTLRPVFLPTGPTQFATEAACQASLAAQVEQTLTMHRQRAAATPGHFVTVIDQSQSRITYDVGYTMGTTRHGSREHAVCHRAEVQP